MKAQRNLIRQTIIICTVFLVLFSSTVLFSVAPNSGEKGKQTVPLEIPNSSQPFNAQEYHVNPFSSYSAEPAPMGIADYGLGYGGTPYNYSTTSFLGIISLYSLSTMNSTAVDVLGNMTFQLNLNLVFTSSGIQYDYWVQNVAYVNTSNNEVSFLDNVWNLSSQHAAVYNSSLIGNGTLSSAGNFSFYYDLATSSLKGNNISLTYPTAIQLKMIAARSILGLPEVDFLYNDGWGWIVYDNVIFQFAKETHASPAFYVDGSTYNPFGTYYDAELIMGGPGNGSQTEDVNSSVYMTLNYYNGHNYQSIQNAYNFGSDTAESIYNVSAQGVYNETNGQLYSKASNGPGALKLIYYAGELSGLRILSTIQNGALFINDTNITDFKNGTVNVSLFPGTYSIKLYDYSSGTFSDLGNLTLTAGKQYNITNDLYVVEFLESGLRSGVTWYLNVSGQSSGPISGSTYSLDLQNGTYNYSFYSSSNEYHAVNGSGTFVVNGSSLKMYVTFMPQLFNVIFVESGLPQGTRWTVTLNGKGSSNSTNDSIAFSVTNGTYDFIIPRVNSYGPAISTGSVTVRGNATTENVLFSILDGYFVGSIKPGNAFIVVNGTTYRAADGNYNISLEPGNYSLKITAAGYVTFYTNITISSLKVTHIQVTNLVQNVSHIPYVEVGALVLLLLVIILALALTRRRK